MEQEICKYEIMGASFSPLFCWCEDGIFLIQLRYAFAQLQATLKQAIMMTSCPCAKSLRSGDRNLHI